MKIIDLLKTSEVIAIGKGVDLEDDVALESGDSRGETILSFYYDSCAGEHKNSNEDSVVITDIKAYFDKQDNAILVENARLSMAEAYRIWFGVDDEKIKLIGVTGTNGKTTTATVIYRTLLTLGVNAGFMGTGRIEYNGTPWSNEFYSMTTPPPSILFSSLKKMINAGCEWCIMEVSSHALVQSRLGLSRFKLAVFTNLTPEHMDYHQSMENYFLAKLKLLEASDLSIINIDDEYGARAYQLRPDKSIGFSAIKQSDFYITKRCNMGLEGQKLFIKSEHFTAPLFTMLPAIHNAYNVSLAFITLKKIGIAPSKIRGALQKIKSISGRCEIIHNSPTVIIDYAHTPKAIESLLDFVKSQRHKNQRIISIVGCGGERDKVKRPLIGKIITESSDLSVITEDNSRNEPLEEIISDICAGINNASNFKIIADRQEAIICALKKARPSDIVLIIGKGHEEYLIDSSGTRHFSEKEIVRKYYGEKE